MARGRRRTKRKEPVPGYLWMLGGFALGLIVALGLYLSRRPPGPAAPLATPPVARSTQPASAAPSASANAAGVTASNSAPAATPDADGSSTAGTRFEFYDVLPEYEVVVPDTGGDLRADPVAASTARSGNYIVQAGAFRTHADADKMQARLALLGIESQIQRVAVDDNVYHRVRIGPVTDLGELNRIRRRLRDERIDYLLIDTPD